MAKATTTPRRGFGEFINEFEDLPALGAEKQDGEVIKQVDVKLISPNPFQPRSHFKPAKLKELANSIKEDGIQNPLILTHDQERKGHYWIVAGGRRYKASTEIVKLKTVPAIIREATTEQLIAWANIENTQRDDLDPVDEATSYRTLQEKCGMSQEQIATRVGKPRTTITLSLRLLDLPDYLLDAVRKGFGEVKARAFLRLVDAGMMDECRKLFDDSVKNKLPTAVVSAKAKDMVDAAKKATEARKITGNLDASTGVNLASELHVEVQHFAPIITRDAIAVNGSGAYFASPQNDEANHEKMQEITGDLDASTGVNGESELHVDVQHFVPPAPPMPEAPAPKPPSLKDTTKTEINRMGKEEVIALIEAVDLDLIKVTELRKAALILKLGGL